ncbi:UPF0187 protein At3g61320, chloroplastic [Amborella trichopoda]|uniref:UPF0187 protein At3g61320, chloroplastic n=1 Tax=Amborella trichopoda TaxID=13333 RepID=UPI0009BDFA61|nr:UPF0187 protein At3g61320, chloroplastic [Amborella trichopoda]|eukprot:XP_020525951.1 UPF0187 protein At3g61320, chloroplastic [Amborella trichopoda]
MSKLHTFSSNTHPQLPPSKTLTHFHHCFSLSTRAPGHRILCSQNPQLQTETQTLSLSSILTAITGWADQIKERGMRKERHLYTHNDWIQHRSSLRHVRHLLSSLSSRVVLSLVPPVLFFTTVAAVIASYNTAILMNWVPSFFPLLRASSLPYQLTAPALALLLVFRTEASYSRFEEGRKAWGTVITGANELARLVGVSVREPVDRKMKSVLIRYIMAFPVALKCHVIYGSDIHQDLRDLLDEGDLEVVLSSKHHPRCIIEFISQSLQLVHLDEAKRNILVNFGKSINFWEVTFKSEANPICYMQILSVITYYQVSTYHCLDSGELQNTRNYLSLSFLYVRPDIYYYVYFWVLHQQVGVLIEEPFPMLALNKLCDQAHESISEVAALQDSILDRLKVKERHLSEHPTNGRPRS